MYNYFFSLLLSLNNCFSVVTQSCSIIHGSFLNLMMKNKGH